PAFLEKELVAKSELTDEEVIEVIFSEIKKREEAALAFETGKRPELAEKERKEAVILKNYLPELASEEEIRVLAEEAIKEIGAKEMKDMGRVMADLVPKLKGRADNTLVSRVVKELLTAPPR
ncbi:MAG: glutamyl-tRNA amidotransferase, partial [Candidatus Nealsonbacteria bacterium CG08_land_8_20_14_0_20_43_11]